MLNEKCSDFSEWDVNYNPTTCGSALFTLFIKQGKKGDAVNYKAITWTTAANLLPCTEGMVALDLGRTCPGATCPSPKKGTWAPGTLQRIPPHCFWLALKASHRVRHQVPIRQRSGPFCSLSAFLTTLQLPGKATPWAITGCSCLVSGLRNFTRHITVLNAFAVLHPCVLRWIVKSKDNFFFFKFTATKIFVC